MRQQVKVTRLIIIVLGNRLYLQLDDHRLATKLTRLPVQELLQHLAHIHQQVKAICNLDSLRCPCIYSQSVSLGAVAADELYVGVYSKPCGERC